MRASYPCVAIFAAVLVCSLRIPAAGAESAFQVGTQLPALSGQTLTGQSLDLPAMAAGKAAVIIFSFNREAGKDAEQWNKQLTAGLPAVGPAYTVILLESVPRLFRGMAVSGIKSGMPPATQQRTTILYKDEALWKQRLGVTDDTRAYVLVIRPDARIAWQSNAAYSDAGFAALKSMVQSMNAMPK